MRLDPVELQSELSRRSGRSVRLILTDNRRRMISARQRGAAVELRLQRIFLDADTDVLENVAALLSGRAPDRGLLRKFIDAHFGGGSSLVRSRREPAAERQTFGAHDIAAYARDLNQTYLNGRSTARVVWGRRSARRSKRSIRFACYDSERNLVIMNRKLDNRAVPAYFVEYVLFHEMLHEVLGIGFRADGRRDIHGRLFKLMESTYPDFDKARRYEKELCRRLGSIG